MKHGERLTRAEKELVAAWGLQPRNWLRERHTPTEFVIVHKYSGNAKVIKIA